MSDFKLAHDRVNGILGNIDAWTSDELQDTAAYYAERAELEHPINRSPDVIAASSIYFAGLMVNEKLTQETVATAADVSKHAIREGYMEIAEAEGIEIKRRSISKDRTQTEPSGFALNRILNLFGGGKNG